MNNKPSLGIGPLTGAERIAALEGAIRDIELPWRCTDDLKARAKEVAINAAKNGLIPTAFIKELIPGTFKNQREAKHEFAKITAIGLAAARLVDWLSLGVKAYEWQWMPMLCDYPEHEGRHWKEFKIRGGDLPSSKYGCRCMGQAIFS